jgi:hypothetical protein
MWRLLFLASVATAEEFDIEHCFLFPGQKEECSSRGQLDVTDDEATLPKGLDDAESARQTLQKLADVDGLYIVRLQRPGMGSLQTAIAAERLVAMSSKGARDYFDVELRDGLPIAMTLKCKNDPLSNLFDDTFVKTRRALAAPGVLIPKALQDALTGSPEAQEPGFFRKYWWVIGLGLLIFLAAGASPEG